MTGIMSFLLLPDCLSVYMPILEKSRNILEGFDELQYFIKALVENGDMPYNYASYCGLEVYWKGMTVTIMGWKWEEKIVLEGKNALSCQCIRGKNL